MARQRGETWSWEETVDFLHLLGEVQEQLNSSHRNQAIYENLAERMNSHRYSRTPHQLRIKAKDLRRQYRNIKEKGQPGKGEATWKYYALLDSIFCKAHNTEPEATTSSSPATEEEAHSEQMNGASLPDKLHCNRSPGYKLPGCNSPAPTRLSNAPLRASAGGPSTSRPLRRRVLRRPHTGIAVGLVKARTKKSSMLRTFTRPFLREYDKNMRRFQQLFQVQIDTQRREMEKLQRQARRSKEEIEAAAGQMREAIFAHAAAVNRVADAIETCNTQLQGFFSEKGPQTGVK